MAEIRSAFAVDDLYGPMIVAMVAMLVMQPAIDEIIHMVAMRDRLMSAARAMDMPRFVPFMSVLRRAAGRVVGGYFNYMLLDIVACLMVQMSIMQIVDVIAMLHPKVTAMSAMMMRMRRRRAGVTNSFRSTEAWGQRAMECIVSQPKDYSGRKLKSAKTCSGIDLRKRFDFLELLQRLEMSACRWAVPSNRIYRPGQR